MTIKRENMDDGKSWNIKGIIDAIIELDRRVKKLERQLNNGDNK